MSPLQEINPNIGFKNPNEFSLRIEEIKRSQELDSYIEAVVWFSENESDLDIEQIAKFLNKKIRDAIEHEANVKRLLKENNESVALFDDE